MTTIICDTRQQMQNKSHKAKEQYFLEHGYKTMHSKLPIGDYSRLDNMSVVVDTKDGLKEVCKNLCSNREEHKRFRAECIKAKDNGIKLIVLVEEDVTDENGHYLINDIRDVHKWQNPRRKIRTKKDGQWVMTYPKATIGLTLMKTMYTMAAKYDVEWSFCRKKDAGKKILELLGVEDGREDIT